MSCRRQVDALVAAGSGNQDYCQKAWNMYCTFYAPCHTNYRRQTQPFAFAAGDGDDGAAAAAAADGGDGGGGDAFAGPHDCYQTKLSTYCTFYVPCHTSYTRQTQAFAAGPVAVFP